MVDNLDEHGRRLLNDLARHQLLRKLFADIATDMTVCRMEGLDPYELPRMIAEEMQKILTHDTPVKKP